MKDEIYRTPFSFLFTELDRPITSVMPRSRAHSSSGGTSHSMYSHSGRPGSGGTSHSMYSHSGRPGSGGTSHSMYSHSGRSHGFSSILEDRKPETKSGKSSTLPASGRYRHPPTSPSRRHDTPIYRPTSPILFTSESPTASPKGSHRKRAESDAYSYVRVKNTYIWCLVLVSAVILWCSWFCSVPGVCYSAQ